jgi:hypothetical protein
MLVRTDPDLKVLGTNSGHFQTNCTLPTRAAGGITILRGWTSVDLSIQGKAVRLINTHLDGDCMDPPLVTPTYNSPRLGKSSRDRCRRRGIRAFQ